MAMPCAACQAMSNFSRQCPRLLEPSQVGSTAQHSAAQHTRSKHNEGALTHVLVLAQRPAQRGQLLRSEPRLLDAVSVQEAAGKGRRNSWEQNRTRCRGHASRYSQAGGQGCNAAATNTAAGMPGSRRAARYAGGTSCCRRSGHSRRSALTAGCAAASPHMRPSHLQKFARCRARGAFDGPTAHSRRHTSVGSWCGACSTPYNSIP